MAEALNAMGATLHVVEIYPAGSSMATQDTASSDSKVEGRSYQCSSSGFIPTTHMKASDFAANSTPQWSLSHMLGLRRNRPSNSWTENPRYQAMQKMLLLNSYPLAYIILWMPGIVNRLIEAAGHKSKVMQLMQASTQLVGLANALTYGWNERISTQVQVYFKGRKQSTKV
jgi:hypothetical protein